MRKSETAIRFVLLCSAAVALLAVGTITYFIFIAGLPALTREGAIGFITGSTWDVRDQVYQVFPFIVGTFSVTMGALVLGVPLGLATAIFLAEFAPKRVARLVRPAVGLLAGIPSVVYGFFGIVVLVPRVRALFGGTGYGIATASMILAVMILPTIISISEDALHAVPKEYREGSLALGATRWHTVSRVVLPAARSGVVTAVILGMGRAIGETMAVIMVAGNSKALPKSIFDTTRTLTSAIAIDMSYASGLHRQALYATAIVLLLFIVLINGAVGLTKRREGVQS